MIEDFKRLLDALGKLKTFSQSTGHAEQSKLSDPFAKPKSLSERTPLGLKALSISGDDWRNHVFFDDQAAFIDAIFASLPADAVIMDDGGEIIRPAMQIDMDGICQLLDRYWIVIGSSEWSKVPDGEPIPQMIIEIGKPASANG